MRSLARALLLSLPYLAGPAGAQDIPFAIEGTTAAPGTLASGMIQVPPGVDEGTFIPITLLHGARPGPVLALVAGVHGSEYSPILALQSLLPKLDPMRLSGKLILVHVANVPSFLGRTVYTGPVDGKNLNRSFPGKPDGTLSERIAHTLTTRVIQPADYVVDLHSGDANEDLMPWTGYYAQHGDPAVIRRSRELAIAFGFDHIVMFPHGPLTPSEAVYTGATATTLGKPSLDVECGGLGRIDPEAVGKIVDGLLSLLRHLGMIEGKSAPAESPRFIERRANLKSEVDGIFYLQVRAGQHVAAGALLGYITDFWARKTWEARAPHAGVVLSVFGTPPARQGETVAVVGELLAQPGRHGDR